MERFLGHLGIDKNKIQKCNNHKHGKSQNCKMQKWKLQKSLQNPGVPGSGRDDLRAQRRAGAVYYDVHASAHDRHASVESRTACSHALHHTPYSTHLTARTLQHAPYSTHLTAHTLQHTPCSTHLTARALPRRANCNVCAVRCVLAT